MSTLLFYLNFIIRFVKFVTLVFRLHLGLFDINLIIFLELVNSSLCLVNWLEVPEDAHGHELEHLRNHQIKQVEEITLALFRLIN